MLTAHEHTLLVATLTKWAETAPDEPMLAILGAGELMRPWDIARAVQHRTEEGEAILEILEHGLRREGADKVVSRFLGRALERVR
jgi:hypothetical protein